MSSEEGFPDYTANTNDAGPALYAFVIAYIALCLLLLAPLVVWGRQKARPEQNAFFQSNNVTHKPDMIGLGQQPDRQDPPLQDSRAHAELAPVVSRTAQDPKQGVRQGEQDPASTVFRDGQPKVNQDASRNRSFVHNIGDALFREVDKVSKSSCTCVRRPKYAS